MPGHNNTRFTLIDALIAAWLVIAIAGLFVLDVTQPRGVIDGVGYAAVVAVAVRFGRRTLIAAAAVTTLLTILAAGMLPDEGVSVAGMWANRAFAIASIWIIALLLQNRIGLEARLENRENHMRRHQEALAQMVREGLLADRTFEDRLQQVCRVAVDALQADAGAFFQRNEDDRTVTVIAGWRASGTPPFSAGEILKEEPNYKAQLRRELVVATEDAELSDLHAGHRPVLRRLGLRAVLAAEVFHGAVGRTATIAFGHAQPYAWSSQEVAFARAVASLVGLLLSAQRNFEILTALEFAEDGICIEDASSRVQYANRAARRFSADCLWPLPPLASERERDRHEIVLAGCDLEVHRDRLPAGGIIIRIVDVTSRNRANSERARLETRLHEAAKMEAVGQLASGVSHDFNNILAAITGFAGFIMQDQDAGSENRAFAGRILNACDRGKELVEQIVTFADTRPVTHEVFDLGLTVKRSQELLASIMHPGALLEVELAEEPLWISGNEVQLGRLVANLIVNARDALDGGGGGIDVSAAPASPAEIKRLATSASSSSSQLFGELDPARRYARLRVGDTGAGIAPGVMERMFEPFFTTKGMQRGTGLGLAVVLGAVKAHRGACHVESMLGRGTTFSIYLPVADGPASATAPVSRKPCHVLIIDDEADIADLLSIGLERIGFQTVAAQDPLEALAAVTEDPAAFDAILTDYDMPGMSGAELIKRIKAISPHVRAVLCTGRGDVSEAEVVAAGADILLRKPVEIPTVAVALRGSISAFTM